jgi:hypothetical protein
MIAQLEVPRPEFKAEVRISSMDGTHLLSIATPWSDVGQISIEDRARIHCQVESLPLVPGEYWVSVGAAGSGRYFEILENISLLTVKPPAASDTDLIPQYKVDGYFWVDDADWKVETDF